MGDDFRFGGRSEVIVPGQLRAFFGVGIALDLRTAAVIAEASEWRAKVRYSKVGLNSHDAYRQRIARVVGICHEHG